MVPVRITRQRSIPNRLRLAIRPDTADVGSGTRRAATTFVLLQAGADPTLENQFGANALDLAHGEAVFYQLSSGFSRSAA